MRRDGVLRFIYDGGGFGLVPSGSSWCKGVEYIPDGAERHAKPLSDLSKASEFGEGLYIREIEPGWYVFFQSYN
jgi:hypothetical protein